MENDLMTISIATSTDGSGKAETESMAGRKRLLCRTGSGGCALDLVASLPDASVLAFDGVPGNNALLELKSAAIARLDRETALSFLGLVKFDKSHRVGIFDELAPSLGKFSRIYWYGNLEAVEDGIWHDGIAERRRKWASRFLRTVARDAISELIWATSWEERRKAWMDHCRGRFAERALSLAVAFSGIRGDGKGLVTDTLGLVDAVGTALAEAGAAGKIGEGHEWKYLLDGPSGIGEDLPYFLTEEGYERTKSGLGRLRILEMGAESLSPEKAGRFDGISLHGMGNGMEGAPFVERWKGVLSVAETGAVWIERHAKGPASRIPFDRFRVDGVETARILREDPSPFFAVRRGIVRGH